MIICFFCRKEVTIDKIIYMISNLMLCHKCYPFLKCQKCYNLYDKISSDENGLLFLCKEHYLKTKLMEIQEIIDKQKENLNSNIYLEMCNDLKKIYDLWND